MNFTKNIEELGFPLTQTDRTFSYKSDQLHQLTSVYLIIVQSIKIVNTTPVKKENYQREKNLKSLDLQEKYNFL